MSRREYPPGVHLWRRGRVSEYAIHLREKQKMKRHYGIMEKQFRSVFAKALKQKGNTGENLVKLLERRLDNVVYLAGLAVSRAQARQLISHGHIWVGEHRVDKPSYLVTPGQVIKVEKKGSLQEQVKASLEAARDREIPAWIQADYESLQSTVLRSLERQESGVPAQEHLVVEFASR